MAITRDQPINLNATGSLTSGGLACTLTVSPSAGDKIIVVAWGTAGTLSVTDSKSQSYTAESAVGASGYTGNANAPTLYVFYFDNTASGVTSVTLKGTTTGNTLVGAGYAVSGAASGNAELSRLANSGGATSPWDIGALVPTDTAYLIAVAANNSGSSSSGFGINTPFTSEAVEQNGSSFDAGIFGDDIATGSQDASVTFSAGALFNGLVLAYSPGAAAAAAGPQYRAQYITRRGQMPVRSPRGVFRSSPWGGVPSSQLFTQVLSVTTTTAPALVKQVNKLVSVTTTTAPALIKQVGKILAVTTTTAPTLLKQVGKVLSVTTTTTPSLLKQVGKVLSVTTTTVPSLIRQVGKVLSVTTTTSPSLTKLVGKVLAATSTTTAVLTTVKVKLVTLAVTTTTVPAMLRQVGKNLAVTTATSATIRRLVGKALGVTTTTAPGLVKQIAKTLAVTTTTNPVVSAVKQAVAPVLTVVATLISRTGVGLLVARDGAGTLASRLLGTTLKVRDGVASLVSRKGGGPLSGR